MLNNKSILITGGTGSLGKKMVQIILSEYKPKRLIVFSRDELKQFEMAQKWNPAKYPCIEYVLGDVRDKDRLMRVFERVDYIIHAAALKQVPAAERNPEECIKTNVNGAINIIEAAKRNGVKKVVALSTDKACNPASLYGATKLCSDKLFIADHSSHGGETTYFMVVRYGNVLGSRGSVIPFFKERKETGVLPITNAAMTRFWITLDQAAHFVLMALDRGKGGEIFIPRIPSMKITDLATAIAPECKQEIIGIRPGEKLHEMLVNEDEARSAVEFKDCFVVQSNELLREKLTSGIGSSKGNTCDEGFKYASNTNDEWMSVDQLRELIDRIEDDFSIEKSRWAKEDVSK